MSALPLAPQSVHVYCTIVDNYGDIGVCWRLAQQLAHDYGLSLHLWVDHWPAAQQLICELPDAPVPESPSRVNGVVIRPWAHLSAVQDCTGNVLIEGLGLALPDVTLAQLAARADKPIWINLEYFSAEDWVPRFHLQSGFDTPTHARRWFFFPGVHAHSGGILRERGLIAQRDAWLAQAQAGPFLAQWGLNVAQDASQDVLKILCFAYAHAPYAAWLDALTAQRDWPLSLWLAGAYTQAAFARLDHAKYPAVKLINLPFVSQSEFDRLLWSADVVWVRGEDSLARGLWSGKPLVWHIYPQAENAHHPKLAAWLADYTRPFPAPLREAYIALHEAWNGVVPAAALGPAWNRLMGQWADWQAWSRIRSREYAQTADLASRLISFLRSADH